MRRIALPIVVAVVLVAGCGASDGGGAGTGSGKADLSAGAASPGKQPDSVAAGGETTGAGQRGNQAATVGRPVTVADDAGNHLLELTVASITSDYPCPVDPALRQDPANGHYLAVELTVAAQPGLAEFDNPYGAFTLLNNGAFTVLDADGAAQTADTLTPQAVGCSVDGDQVLYQEIAPGRTYSGVLVLDVTATEGTLVWQPVITPGSPDPGWEWPF